MIDLIVTLPEYLKDTATKRVWSWIQSQFPKTEGQCYYMHPVLVTPSNITPELTLITKTHQPVIIRCLPLSIEGIQDVTEVTWTIDDNQRDSPLLEAEDFAVVLKSKFDKDRILRKRLEPIPALALPLISEHTFSRRFPNALNGRSILWANGDLNCIVKPLKQPLTDVEWRHARSIAQGVNPLTPGTGGIFKEAATLGEAIRNIDRQIALLDEEQAKAALQMAPGPQQIRGLPGTGKTVLLAMKAANLHLRYPEKKILFTFHTQSLYNQVRTLISKFYRSNSDQDPDWDNLHVRHSWGGARKNGVYYEACTRLGILPLSLGSARQLDREVPFRACCKHVLSKPIQEAYDFIMIDEAQDFPAEYFRVLYRLSKPPHQLYWAYDDLQNLFGKRFPTPEELFGIDGQGQPLVSFGDDLYPGGIEKDIVLHRSYRCPRDVLMLAHAIALGIYSPNNCVQMLNSKESWEALGYIIESGDLIEGSDVTVCRPKKNSPNPVIEQYKGNQELITVKHFDDRKSELEWIADSIHKDITGENVLPEHIIVICLDAPISKQYLPPLQKLLNDRNVPSTIPGIMDDSAAFGEKGSVTLSTVFRAKGNESYIVYIFCFDTLLDYAEEIENRNRAFTAISRSKAWVRITGVGNGMADAMDEIDRVLADLPKFHFRFPNMDLIRNLSAETARRRREIKRAQENITSLMDLDPKALEAVVTQNPNLFEELIKKIAEAKKK